VGAGAGSPGSLTGSGSARPTYRATGSPSGGPCVEFDGSDDYLSLETPAGLPDGADAGTLVALVARCPAGGSGYDHLVQFGAAANLGARGLAYAGDQWVTVDWASNLAGESTSPRTAAAVVLGHSYDGTTRRLWLDGNPIARDTPSLATGTTRLVVGRNLTGGYGGEHAAFRLVFVAIYSTVLRRVEDRGAEGDVRGVRRVARGDVPGVAGGPRAEVEDGARAAARAPDAVGRGGAAHDIAHQRHIAGRKARVEGVDADEPRGDGAIGVDGGHRRPRPRVCWRWRLRRSRRSATG